TIPVEPVVLVVEDVVAIPPEVFRELSITRAGLHEPERLAIVVADRPGDVIPDDGVPVHFFSRLALKGCRRSRRLHLDLAGTPAGLREVTDRVPWRHRSLFRRPLEPAPVASGQEDESLTVLRNSIAPGIQKARFDVVAGRLETPRHDPEDEGIILECHV